MTKKRRILTSIVAILLVGTLLLGLGSSILMALAAESDTIQGQMDDLQQEADEIAKEREALEEEINSKEEETKSVVERKSEIDRSVELTRQEVENLEAQTREYNRLIAAKQEELDNLLAKEQQCTDQYKLRLRAMEERGTQVSYWEILCGSASFTDLVDRIEMIQEIENSDRLMLQQLKQSAARVAASREALAAEKIALSEKREDLEQAQQELQAQREEADQLVQELNASLKDMQSTVADFEAKEDELVAQIAEKEKEYWEALEREREEAEQAANNAGSTGSSGGGSDRDPDYSGGGSDSGWLFPVGGYAPVTSPYGYRWHPTNGNYSFHTGVDLGAGYGTPVYASRSGTVTEAAYGEIYGNYVTINHEDGYSTLYGHMEYSTVSAGQWVSQGEVIGYVGSTGWSTGAHLHFTVYYYGSHVNPMEYISAIYGYN